MSDPESNLLVELRGPFNGCCFKERCIAWIETLERENLNLLHDQERLEREVAELRRRFELAQVHLWWDEKAGLWSTNPPEASP